MPCGWVRFRDPSRLPEEPADERQVPERRSGQLVEDRGQGRPVDTSAVLAPDRSVEVDPGSAYEVARLRPGGVQRMAACGGDAGGHVEEALAPEMRR